MKAFGANVCAHRILILLVIISLQGCVAGTVIDVVAETVEAGIELTGAAVSTAVDAVLPDANDEDDE